MPKPKQISALATPFALQTLVKPIIKVFCRAFFQKSEICILLDSPKQLADNFIDKLKWQKNNIFCHFLPLSLNGNGNSFAVDTPILCDTVKACLEGERIAENGAGKFGAVLIEDSLYLFASND